MREKWDERLNYLEGMVVWGSGPVAETFEEFWVEKDVVNRQVLQKANVGSHLRGWSQGGSWKSP